MFNVSDLGNIHVNHLISFSQQGYASAETFLQQYMEKHPETDEDSVSRSFETGSQ